MQLTESVLQGDMFFTKRPKKGLILQIATTSPGCMEQESPPAILADLPADYAEVFSTPVGLPPVRGHENQIILREGTPPVSARPYRYPYFQKSEIEKIEKELLEVGSIRPSQSPFFSPVYLLERLMVVVGLIIGL